MMTLNFSCLFEKLSLIRDIRNYPIDLKIALLWTLGTILCVYLPFLQDSLLRPVFGVLFLLIVPGYLFTAALFPASDDIEWIERIALTFGLSIAVVPLIGLGLNYTPWGIRLTPIVTALVIFTLAMTGIAAYRRLILPEENRFFVPILETIQGIKSEFFPDHTTRVDRALSMLLFGAIILLIATTVFVILFPQDGERFTEFYILGEKGKTTDYPTTFWNGTRQEVTVGIGNHEQRNVNYTVEVYGLNQLFDTTTNTSTILKTVPLGSISTAIPNNETLERQFNFMVNDTTINRIQYLLFDDKHQKPDYEVSYEELINNSYLNLHLGVTIDKPRPFFRIIDRVLEEELLGNKKKVDITGEWEVTASTDKGIIYFKQSGDKLSGYFINNKNFINGRIAGNKIYFQRERFENSHLIQDYSGTLSVDPTGKKIITGTVINKAVDASWSWKAIKKQ